MNCCPKWIAVLMHKTVLLFSHHSNQVQTEHNISVTLRAAANFALPVKCLLAFIFFIHPVVITAYYSKRLIEIFVFISNSLFSLLAKQN